MLETLDTDSVDSLVTDPPAGIGFMNKSWDHHKGGRDDCVKSTALMTYLIKLVTPPGGVVLDPFMGSGSTGVSSKSGFYFIGVEQEKAYAAIARRRLRL